eukprot:TRINITY_DN21958_c1_g5_i1.p1 TRINITY_DN21958_c1_g5~~TRINITY_DN21958_c1_g5_i1.p1  ORF type:complete len:298 (+),score=38.12 TRINITY_DN21958_c1_g5_i1:206-1099(+)
MTAVMPATPALPCESLSMVQGVGGASGSPSSNTVAPPSPVGSDSMQLHRTPVAEDSDPMAVDEPEQASPDEPDETVAEPTARRAPLRLPDIRPRPLPSDEELMLICRMHGGDAVSASDRLNAYLFGGSRLGGTGAAASSSRSGVATSGARSRNAGTGRLCSADTSFDDFLGGGGACYGQRSNRSTGRASRVGERRPMLRQAIDDDTFVPNDVFEQMLRLGSEAKARASHTIAFAPPTGEPYLRRYDAPARTVPLNEAVALTSRPASACAFEHGGAGCVSHAIHHAGGALDSVPLQVL